jgi:hypothetical protein
MNRRRIIKVFIYVIDIKGKEFLEGLGYTLLKDRSIDRETTVWVFANVDENQLDGLDVPYIISDTLIF